MIYNSWPLFSDDIATNTFISIANMPHVNYKLLLIKLV